ncbi:MAG: lipocalin family protein [Melioribacteraceae bacterium]|nr:lipocalin family protein [Melioribacteraceae bacterium]
MKRIIILFSILVLISCTSSNYLPLETVDKVDVNKYLGKWYEIASIPNSFQKGCQCTSAEYSLIDSETIRVKNRCKKDNEIDDVEGKAFIVEGSNNAKLKVQFFWPFKGDYWIIELDNDYKYAVVGTPSRKYLWILSREPKLDENIYQMLLQKIKNKNFDISKIQKTIHDCN